MNDIHDPSPQHSTTHVGRQTRKIKSDHNPDFNRIARAPYNFVPLNETVIYAQPFQAFDFYDTETRITGYINCEIKTLTPLYIRDCQSEEDNKNKKQPSDFYAPAGRIQIPGSSLRGMVRTLTEILTWSKLPTELDRVLHYRALADKSNLRKEYQSHMSSFDPKRKSTTYKMNAGFLRKRGVRYEIIPAQYINGKQFTRIPMRESRVLMPQELSAGYFFKHEGNYIIISGRMPNKKHDWIVYPPNLSKEVRLLKIPDVDVKNFLLDENRKGNNLIEILDKNKKALLPCFYVQYQDEDNKPRVSFGHTPMFRLAYQKSFDDLLPDSFDYHQFDMAEAIFGTVSGKTTLAGRVYFEDANVIEPVHLSQGVEQVPEILSTPKPTTFQHYLVQKSDFIRELNHYNSNTFLRGNKLYWHRQRNWRVKELSFDKDRFISFIKKNSVNLPSGVTQVKDTKMVVRFESIKDEKVKNAIYGYIRNEDDKTQYTIIKTVREGVTFQARIRFENLTDVELGALLTALQLPEHSCHKLGMGKPLGLGSIKISPRLYLSDRKKRYGDILAEWTEGLAPESDQAMHEFKSKFENFILHNLSDAEKPASGILWDTYRLQQLKTILDWRNTQKQNWIERTRYLEIEHGPDKLNEYKNRPILPIPEDVAR